LSQDSLSLQVNEFEQLYKDTKLQIKDLRNNLTLEKVFNQNQLDALSLQIVMLDQKVINVSNEKDKLFKENNILREDILLQRQTIQEYKKLEDRKRKEKRNIKYQLSYDQESFKMVDNIPYAKVFKSHWTNENELQNFKLKNFILMSVLAAFQIVYDINNEESKQNIINSMESLLNILK